MKISIFVKTFLLMIVTFSFLFLTGMYFAYLAFTPMYLDKNINAVKNAVQDSRQMLLDGMDLEDTPIGALTNETTFVRIQGGVVESRLGAELLTDEDILQFVISIYDSITITEEGSMIYDTTQEGDVYVISYLLVLAPDDYLLIRTNIQSLHNVDLVLTELGWRASIGLVLTVTAVSLFVSLMITLPIRRINAYAKRVSSLDFSKTLTLRRRDEFRELVTSLNEMTFHLKKSYATLTEANQRLAGDIEFEKRQEEKKKQLIMAINHELKTPIAVIKGMVEGMIDGVGRYKNKEKYLREVLSELDEVERMTKDLTYSLRLEDLAKEGDQTSTQELKESLHPLMELAKEKGVRLKLDFEDGLIPINKEHLSLLASNLIKNAIMYTDGDTVQVTLQLQPFEFEVRNPGQIPESELERIFEPYYRVQQIVSNDGGTGLGLYLVRQIAEIHKLSIRIFNDGGCVVAKLTNITESVTELS